MRLACLGLLFVLACACITVTINLPNLSAQRPAPKSRVFLGTRSRGRQLPTEHPPLAKPQQTQRNPAPSPPPPPLINSSGGGTIKAFTECIDVQINAPLPTDTFKVLEAKMVRSHAKMRNAVNKAIPLHLHNAIVNMQGTACSHRGLMEVLFPPSQPQLPPHPPTADGPPSPAGEHAVCTRTRIVIFGGSMTWGRDAVYPEFRPMCPGCTDPREKGWKGGLKTPPGLNVFTNEPHCCSWPNFLARALDDAFSNTSHRIQLINLAVPATSTAWLQSQVSGLASIVPGGPLTPCDLVLLDYSVNDADAKALYADQEENLVDALVAVHDALRPTPMVILQAYPWGGRQDRWGARASSANFSYSNAYRKAAALRKETMPLLDLSSFLMHAGRDAELLWPHPPWEQRAFATVALH